MRLQNVEIKHRNLPHWHANACLQFVTFRLNDSLPASIRQALTEYKLSFLRRYPQPWDKEIQKFFSSIYSDKINEYLDVGYGNCWLRRLDCATIVENALYKFNNERYLLHHYVVMSNHVHVLVQLCGLCTTSEICHSWKSFTSKKINKLVGRTGNLWKRESWDTMVRDESHYQNILNYINKNISVGGILWMKDIDITISSS